MEYFVKVFIKSEDDLPKKDGVYIAHYRRFSIDSPAGTILSHYSHLNEHERLNWLQNIDWYLKPVELPEITDEEIIIEWADKEIPHDFKLTKAQSIIASIIVGAKWYRSELKKRMT